MKNVKASKKGLLKCKKSSKNPQKKFQKDGPQSPPEKFNFNRSVLVSNLRINAYLFLIMSVDKNQSEFRFRPIR